MIVRRRRGAERPSEPRLREPQISHRGRWRHAKHVADFVEREPAEVAQLDRLGVTRVSPFELPEGFIKRHDRAWIGVVRRHQCMGEALGVERNMLRATTALLRSALLRVIDEDPTHGARRDGEEMRAILPIDRSGRREAQIGLVNECRRAQRVIRSLGPETRLREATKLVVDARDERVERLLVAISPASKVAGQIVVVRGRIRSRYCHAR